MDWQLLKNTLIGWRNSCRSRDLRVLVATIPALARAWYPPTCCGNMDCFPVACDQLVETVSGSLYVPTGNVFIQA
jgi:hypothetical protein